LGEEVLNLQISAWHALQRCAH